MVNKMKKLCTLIICLVLFFLLTSCGNSEKVDNAKINICSSSKFSQDEIKEAMECVKAKFKDFKGCKLTDLWYDEKKSDFSVKDYIEYGKGSVNGATAKNTIVLLSNFKVDSTGGDGSLNSNSTYSDWEWILIRDNKSGKWKVDDWGY